MEQDTRKQLRLWLKKKLAERGRGAKADLANYLGADRTAITRMLTQPKTQGYRVITADELVKMARFFNEIPPGLRDIGRDQTIEAIVESFQRLPSDNRQLVQNLIASLAQGQHEEE